MALRRPDQKRSEDSGLDQGQDFLYFAKYYRLMLTPLSISEAGMLYHFLAM